jgi:hypothetical protein
MRNWVEGGLGDQYNSKIVNLVLAASCKDYRISHEVNHVSSTVEDVLKRLTGGAQGQQQIGHDDPDAVDGELIE